MTGPAYIFLNALLCLVATYLSWPWRLGLIPLAVALSCWLVVASRRR